jgi:periplasmic divalent cation tolerance protein
MIEKTTKLIEVSTAFEDKLHAEKLVGILLQERLIVCGQIVGPVISSYWWKGTINTSTEFVLLMKTTTAHYERLEKMIQSNHPYEVPEIIAVPITHISDDYRNWMEQELDS